MLSVIYFDLFLNSRTATLELFLNWIVESNRPKKKSRIWLEIYSLQTQPLSKSRVQSCFLLSIFREEKVSIDEKHFECRAENDFNTFGTIVTISQSEPADVVFLLGLMAQGSVTFSTDRQK